MDCLPFSALIVTLVTTSHSSVIHQVFHLFVCFQIVRVQSALHGTKRVDTKTSESVAVLLDMVVMLIEMLCKVFMT